MTQPEPASQTNPAIDVSQLAQLQVDCVTRWHGSPIDNPATDETSLAWHVCQQHQFNFRLWHQEDLARQPDADDATIARLKRTIDALNQSRNDWIEKIDEVIATILDDLQVSSSSQTPCSTETPCNTETLGAALDRASIMSLRIYHHDEELRRRVADSASRGLLQQRARLCQAQRRELVRSMTRLATDLVAGRVRHQTVRQLKMYNDPMLNPAIYNHNAPDG